MVFYIKDSNNNNISFESLETAINYITGKVSAMSDGDFIIIERITHRELFHRELNDGQADRGIDRG